MKHPYMGENSITNISLHPKVRFKYVFCKREYSKKEHTLELTATAVN